MSSSSPRLPRRLLAWAVLAVPLLVDPHGDTLSLKILALALLGLCLLLGESIGQLSGRRPGLRPEAPELLLGLLGLWAAASLLWARSPGLGLLGVGMLLGLPGVARAVRQMARGPLGVQRWIIAWVAVGLLAVLVDGGAILMREGTLAATERKYASWLFAHNNLAAAWAVMLVPMAAALIVIRRAVALALPALLALIAYLAILHSRAGIAGALVGLAVLGLAMLLRKRLRRPGRRAALLLSLLVLAGLSLPFSESVRGLAKDGFYQTVAVLERLGIGTLGDALFRPNVWRRTLNSVVAEAPLLGVGEGNFMVAYSHAELGQVEIPHAHNDELQLLAELGLPGVALFLGLLSSLVWQLLGVLARTRDDRPSYVLAAGLAGSLAVFVLAGQFEVPFALGATAANLALLTGWVGALALAPKDLSAGSWRVPAVVLALIATAALVPVLLRLPASHWNAQASERYRAGDLEGARRLYQRMSDLGLGAHLPQLMLGQLDLEQGDPEGAVDHFRRARQIWPDDTDLLIREGEALMLLGRFEEAMPCFRAALASSPADPAAVIALVRALERADQLDEAIARAEFLVQQDHLASLDVVQILARMLNRKALQSPPGPARAEALVAARHFYAQLLQDGEAGRWPVWNREFKHLTHQLQQLPGAPESWWAVYDGFLAAGGWSRPRTALWTSMDADGVQLFPGWQEKAGPPRPRAWR